ncbi:MAG: radical SAM protein [bacterium]|nr:radical SAM protein [bacterium]
MVKQDVSWINTFVNNIAPYVHVRKHDSLLILVPNQAYMLNRTALDLLTRLLAGETVEEYLELAGDTDLKREDIHSFFCDLRALLMGCWREGEERRAVETVEFSLPFNDLPVLSEIAVTYRCNLRCRFCYVGDSNRKRTDERDMDLESLKKVLRVRRPDADIPSVSFTGGEPTLLTYLEEAVAYAVELGLRVNLITNGTLLTKKRVTALKEAGLSSAQVSVEGPTAEIHDALTMKKGSFDKTWAGIHNLRQAGLVVHTNTTLSRKNAPFTEDIVRLAKEQGMERFSMNLAIPCGSALEYSRDVFYSYSEVSRLIPGLKRAARQAGIEFLWYSPTPYCLFNPIAEGLGNKSCAACDGLLSISPLGEVLPCSSFSQGVGNVLEKDFKTLWSSALARFYQEKKYAPAKCRDCEEFLPCQGACPLYWDAVGTAELDGSVSVCLPEKMTVKEAPRDVHHAQIA